MSLFVCLRFLASHITFKPLELNSKLVAAVIFEDLELQPWTI
jgi:hypothetical protein